MDNFRVRFMDNLISHNSELSIVHETDKTLFFIQGFQKCV